MATPAQINEQSIATLTDLERELVRDILGINGRAGDAVYVESDTRMAATTDSQRQMIRALIYIDAPDYDLDTNKIQGGSDGLNVDPERTLKAIRNKLRRILYPSDRNDPANDLDNTSFVSYVPVNYESGSTEYD